jgi:hypothetical protein
MASQQGIVIRFHGNTKPKLHIPLINKTLLPVVTTDRPVALQRFGNHFFFYIFKLIAKHVKYKLHFTVRSIV